jgi:hypothetical protein
MELFALPPVARLFGQIQPQDLFANCSERQIVQLDRTEGKNESPNA